MARNGLFQEPVRFDRIVARYGDRFSFEAQVVEAAGVTGVVVAGEIDMATAGLFRQAIDHASQDGRVLIDLAGTTFIDSSGLAVLIDTHDRLGRRAEAVVLHAVDPRIQQVLELSGMGPLVTLVDEPLADRLTSERPIEREREAVV